MKKSLSTILIIFIWIIFLRNPIPSEPGEAPIKSFIVESIQHSDCDLILFNAKFQTYKDGFFFSRVSGEFKQIFIPYDNISAYWRE